jgi:uncharacterized protein YjdB
VAALVPGITTVTASVDGKTGSAELAVVPGPVAAVEVVPSAGTVAVTTSLQLTATARDAGGFVVPGEAVAWVSSAPGIATVSSTGTVTGLVPGGPVTVTATIAGKTAAASLTVVPGPVATVQVTPTATTLEVGQSLELAAVPKDAQGNAVTARPVTWTSSAPAVAPVSSSGGVSALTPGGPVVITATIDGQSGGASVTVIPAAVASVEVRPGVATVDYGGTLQLAALPRSARGDVLTGRLVQWASANPTQVSVSPTGLVTGLASGGPITITATIEGRSAGAAITVARPMAVAVPLWFRGRHTAGAAMIKANWVMGR